MKRIPLFFLLLPLVGCLVHQRSESLGTLKASTAKSASYELELKKSPLAWDVQLQSHDNTADSYQYVTNITIKNLSPNPVTLFENPNVELTSGRSVDLPVRKNTDQQILTLFSAHLREDAQLQLTIEFVLPVTKSFEIIAIQRDNL